MKKYKILHIITRFDKGGSAENTFLTLMGLDKNKYNLTLMKGTSSGFNVNIEEKKANEKDIERLITSGIRVITVKTLIRSPNPLFDLITLLRIFVICAVGNYDIVHTHTSKAGFIGRWAAFFAGIPAIIHTPHGHIFTKYFSKTLTFIYLNIERISSLITDKIITLTKGCYKDHLDFKAGHPDKFEIIHSGIDLNKFNVYKNLQVTKKRLDIPENHLIVGTVGRLVPIKGHKYLIDAIKKVVEELPNVTFIFAGDGELQTSLEEQTERLDIKKHVRFTGWRSDVSEIFSILDLFVLPSLNEGMGKVLVEAMLMEKSIVASNVGGIPELVLNGVNGILVPPGDSHKLSIAILNLLKDKTMRRDMGLKGKDMAKLYSSDRMVDMIDKLYSNCMYKKG